MKDAAESKRYGHSAHQPWIASDAAKAEAMIEGIAALIAEIGLETRLRQVGISHNHVPMLAEDAMKQTRLLVNNPREVGYDDAVRIYEAAL